MGGLTIMIFADPPPGAGMFVALVLLLAPIPIYFFIKWIFGGFKKEEKKKK